jgi:hypothetical protein
MPDTVNSQVLLDGPRNYIVHLTNVSDSTGESAVVKIDISGLTLANGAAPSKLTIDEIAYSIQGFTSVRLFWDADTDDEIAVLSGDGHKVFPGGLVDPRSTGAVGDVLLTTAGAASGATYDITIVARKKN